MIVGQRKRIANIIQVLGTAAVFLGLGSEFDELRNIIVENTGKLVALTGGLGLIVDHYIGTATKRESIINEENEYNKISFRENEIKIDILEDDLSSAKNVNKFNEQEINNLRNKISNLESEDQSEELSSLDEELSFLSIDEDD